jgi:translation initiation factor IF-2
VSQPKVFEFAKELGLQTLELMDRLRDWKVPVRSHMAELDNSTLDLIRGKLREETDSKKKPVTKKKVAAAPTSEKPVAKAAPKTAKATSSKTSVARPATTKTVAAERATTSAASAAATEAAAADTAKRVIRRKSNQLASNQPEVREREEKVAEETMAAPVAEAHQVAAPEVETPVPPAEPELPPAVRQVAKATVKAEPAAPVARAPEKEIPAVVVEASAPAATAESAPAVAAAAPAAAAEAARPAAPRPGLKKEVVMAPGATRTRGNIVGRMDLSRAVGPRPQPGQQGQGGYGGRPQGGPGGGGYGGRPQGGPGGGGYGGRPQGGPGGGGFGGRPQGGPGGGGFGARPQGAGGFQRGGPAGAGTSMRPGFFAVGGPAPDMPMDRHNDRMPRRKPGGGSGGRPGAPGTAGDEGSQKEEVIENFSSTEFRKREIVFQPKKNSKQLNREALKPTITQAKASKRIVEISQTIKVTDLAKAMSVKASQVIATLMKSGVMLSANDNVDADTAALIAPEFGYEIVNVHRSADDMLKESAVSMAEGNTTDRVTRPPIVTVMGHVDHGKTSLLDAIRQADVAAKEAGGITQHIGAYTITLADGKSVTFIDTPGHQAFTAMRARGANVTDVVIIVVAADDGVMPQTVEAINHAKSAKVPIIVAINKMDKPNINVEKIKQQLTEYELVPEEWGGTTIFVPVSAVKKTGIPELLEQIHLVAEMQELRASPENAARGVVIESRMERGRGVIATVIIQDGTLEVGKPVVAGQAYGRVRAMLDDKGKPIKSVGPSGAVEILGLNMVPMAGDRFDVTEDEAQAREIADRRKDESSKASKTPSPKMSLEDLFSKVQTGATKELLLLIKSDVAGSGEAIKHELEKIQHAEVKVKILHTAVGGINESDVLLASTAKAIIIGFNTRPDGAAASLADREGVEIKTYSIIYELVDDVKKGLSGLLAPNVVEKTLGRAEVRNVFVVPKAGTIAGCYVNDGKIVRSAMARLTREGRVIFEGKLGSLKRFKDDAREVQTGFECGISIENYNDIKVGDVIEAFEKQSIQREI